MGGWDGGEEVGAGSKGKRGRWKFVRKSEIETERRRKRDKTFLPCSAEEDAKFWKRGSPRERSKRDGNVEKKGKKKAPRVERDGRPKRTREEKVRYVDEARASGK